MRIGPLEVSDRSEGLGGHVRLPRGVCCRPQDHEALENVGMTVLAREGSETRACLGPCPPDAFLSTLLSTQPCPGLQPAAQPVPLSHWPSITMPHPRAACHLLRPG